MALSDLYLKYIFIEIWKNKEMEGTSIPRDQLEDYCCSPSEK